VFKVASWNVNSLAVRLEQVLDWLVGAEIDVLAVQETKVPDERFPYAAFEALGYAVHFCGQKAYNGVALISKWPMHDVVMSSPDGDDSQRRLIAATVGSLRVINLYVPNGAAPGTDKYAYKLNWLSCVNAFIKQQLLQYPKLMVLGDFNIAPDDRDVHDPAAWEGSILVSPDERRALADVLALGLVDSFRLFTDDAMHFSWWDYRGGSFRRNHGARIDLVLLSDALKAVCLESAIDQEPRRASRPSDHAPVWVTLNAL